jgi:hypothetical protein
MFAAAALALAACSNEEAVLQNNVQQEGTPVAFGIYSPRTVTRAGEPGSITTASLKTGAHKDAGFGVFGFYTDNGTYDQYATPNFMYNQQIKWDDTKAVWNYEPVKYWPNEFGDAAASDEVDRLTFFSYAPWVQVDGATGKVADEKANIVGVTKNNALGDPIVKYIVDTDPMTSVDLLWGVYAEKMGDNTTVWPNQYKGIQNGPTLVDGMPFIDCTKEENAANGKVSFNLRHALANLTVTIDADVDLATVAGYTSDKHDVEVGTKADGTTDGKTKIWIRSISFTGFLTEGALNLNNTTANHPLWLNFDASKEIGLGEETITTFYDGRKDGKEGTENGEAKAEKPLGFWEGFAQDYGNTHDGVTNEKKNLFGDGTAPVDQPIFVIPTDDPMDITIIYDVETEDDNLATFISDGMTHGSTIENRIFKTDVFGGVKIEAGKKYVVNLHLGMTSVKIDADVVPWDDTPGQIDVELPKNM